MVQSRRGVAVLMIVLAASGGLMTQQADSQPPRDQFAADRDPGPAPALIKPAPFNSKRAMEYLEAICKIGPRISGTDGMKKQQELVQKHFEAQGAKVEIQRFTARQRSVREPVEMANIIARWHLDRPRRVILCSHYDTRPIADQEPNVRRWKDTFLSANDGGSGVALLMELANHMKDLNTELGVDFVLFDGEEYIHKKGEDEYCLGSKHFAGVYRKARKPPGYLAAILLDMVGGKNAKFPVETNSWFHAAPLVLSLWNTAEELKVPAFQKREGPTLEDDHIPLNRAGIPAVDIIDFSYPHWHRLSDVPANCSGDSLEQVARVLSVWLQRTK